MSIFWRQESRPSRQTRDSPQNTTLRTSGFSWSNMSRSVVRAQSEAITVMTHNHYCRREMLVSTSVRFQPSHHSHIPSLSTLLVMINISVSWYSILQLCSVPHVGIHGSPDLHVNRGSTINLTCVISHTPEPPAYIFWYFNDNVMAYESPRLC